MASPPPKNKPQTAKQVPGRHKDPPGTDGQPARDGARAGRAEPPLHVWRRQRCVLATLGSSLHTWRRGWTVNAYRRSCVNTSDDAPRFSWAEPGALECPLPVVEYISRVDQLPGFTKPGSLYLDDDSCGPDLCQETRGWDSGVATGRWRCVSTTVGSHQQPEVNYLLRFSPLLICLERSPLRGDRSRQIDLFENLDIVHIRLLVVRWVGSHHPGELLFLSFSGNDSYYKPACFRHNKAFVS